MPTNLFGLLTKEEILDLVAYVVRGGNRGASSFLGNRTGCRSHPGGCWREYSDATAGMR